MDSDLGLGLGLLYTDKWKRNFNGRRFGFNQVRHRALSMAVGLRIPKQKDFISLPPQTTATNSQSSLQVLFQKKKEDDRSIDHFHHALSAIALFGLPKHLRSYRVHARPGAPSQVTQDIASAQYMTILPVLHIPSPMLSTSSTP